MPVHRHPIAVSKKPDALASVPLDHQLITRLRDSFRAVHEHGLLLAESFYAKLFAAAPHLRPLFRSDLKSQSEKLIASLDAVVRNLEHPAENAAMLAALGRRHAGYGAKPEHYDIVIELLVDAMGEVLGPSADRRNLEDWRIVLRLVSNQMIAASEDQLGSTGAQPSPPGR